MSGMTSGAAIFSVVLRLEENEGAFSKIGEDKHDFLQDATMRHNTGR
jgi:hypothetical protein